MVSFSCENCGDVLTKKKLDPHRNQCRYASYTCLDCMVHFQGTEYRSHTSCISEAQKYQGNLYKEKKGRKGGQSQANDVQSSPAMNSIKNGTGVSAGKDTNAQALVSSKTYNHESQNSALAIVDAPPEAPEPPTAINVFDFLVKEGGEDDWESERDDDDDMRPEHPRRQVYIENGYSYGSGPIPATLHRFNSHAELRKNRDMETPLPKSMHSRNMSLDSTSAKKSSKRKRGHPEGLDLSKNDIDMTDVPPTLHSGLTGGINRLLSSQNVLPPSPDLSADAISPQSPLKRSKHSRDPAARQEKRLRRKSNSDDEARHKKHSSSSKNVVRRDRRGNAILERRRTRRRSQSPSSTPAAAATSTTPNPSRHLKKQLAIEYHNSQHSTPAAATTATSTSMSQALVRIEHAPTTKSVDMFLTCLAKGSETDEGVSLWKALKRWRKDGGSGEKELWKRLKIRANEDGDLVLCV